ncbi:uncharacterized protein MKZ38_001792 [Zalerion maritima]|uniref:Uncharacterized protein n=1 Tax=Zalerion maritima TaxID=339359 RepID=A0AAD5WXG2_9PEZI|nr:uncharacterized protein MKZ38_001792 [Zalerion maritima]
MIVDLLGEGCPDNPVFLKLYDRRFSGQLRCDHGIDPWKRDAEKEYISAVRTGAARQFLHNLNTIPDFEEDTEETWDDGQIEAFLTGQVHELFDTEATVYDTLRDIQGKLVPRLISRVHLPLALPNAGIGRADAAELLHIKGILLQYIDGFSLSKVQDHSPKSEWQGIVDQAVAIVQVERLLLGVMIDFGLARLRVWNETDRDWAKAKLNKDEEGAVGLVMKKRLAREGFELRFENSDRSPSDVHSTLYFTACYPGRINKQVEFPYANKHVTGRLFRRIFKRLDGNIHDPEKPAKDNEIFKRLAEEFASEVPEKGKEGRALRALTVFYPDEDLILVHYAWLVFLHTTGYGYALTRKPKMGAAGLLTRKLNFYACFSLDSNELLNSHDNVFGNILHWLVLGEHQSTLRLLLDQKDSAQLTHATGLERL